MRPHLHALSHAQTPYQEMPAATSRHRPSVLTRRQWQKQPVSDGVMGKGRGG